MAVGRASTFAVPLPAWTVATVRTIAVRTIGGVSPDDVHLGQDRAGGHGARPPGYGGPAPVPRSPRRRFRHLREGLRLAPVAVDEPRRPPRRRRPQGGPRADHERGAARPRDRARVVRARGARAHR